MQRGGPIDDLISRQAAKQELCKMLHDCFWADDEEQDAVAVTLDNLPSAQQEPLSDAYTKAVWTWLLDYQIKAAELKGRYTPYEVLSWVANDWRKEHDGSD